MVPAFSEARHGIPQKSAPVTFAVTFRSRDLSSIRSHGHEVERSGKKMAKTDHFGVLTAALGVLVAAGLLMLLAVDARTAEAAFAGKPGKIAYEGLDAPNGDFEIYTINRGGGGKVQLTDNSTGDTEPS